MKKNLFVFTLVLTIFLAGVLLIGCSNSGKTSNTTPATNEDSVAAGDSLSEQDERAGETGRFLSNPKITIFSGYDYYFQSSDEEGYLYYSSSSGEDYQVESEEIALASDGFALDLEFYGEIDLESLKSGIKLEGYPKPMPEFSIFQNEAITRVYGNFPDAEPGQIYTLQLAKTIKDVRGKTLAEELAVNIKLDPVPKAYYTLVGQEGTYNNLGSIELIDWDAVGQNHFTTSPKMFLVEFTEDVNKKSVEAAIINSLKDSPQTKYRFSWLDNRKLQLELKGFESGRVYAIYLSQAQAESGYKIIGNLFFKTSSANQIRSININTGETRVLKEFADKRYMAWSSPVIEDYLLLTDSGNRFVFSLQEGKMVRTANLGWMATWVQWLTWLDSESLLYHDWNEKKLLKYSLRSGTITELFSSVLFTGEEDIIALASSPDGNKLALVTEAYGGFKPASLYIVSMEGKVLYAGKELFWARRREVLGPEVNLGWLDDQRVIFEEQEINNYNTHISAVNFLTGAKEMISRQATGPAASSATKTVKLEKYGQDVYGPRIFAVYREGEDIELFKGNGYDYSNFYLLDENRLVFNYQDDVVLFNIKEKKAEVIGQGFIIGTSPDRTKVFYLTNYEFLYHFC